MNLPTGLLHPALVWFANMAFAAALIYCARSAPWHRLHTSARQHVWLGAIVVLLSLWQIKTGVKPGLNFHLLGASVLNLMFGTRLAILALSVVLLGTTVIGGAGWETLGLNGLLMVAFPSVIAGRLLRLAERYLPHHLFVYIFVNAFFGGALTMMLMGVLITGILGMLGVYPMEYLLAEYLPFFILLAWGEAFTSGLLITIFVVYRPAWVGTFDDACYLQGK